ncbi:MAG: sugar ABC transporter ATP-binding protein [Devosia nanyangense]|uniref:Sugar ABC transporter ATP-binding protein n=1 Tax=Devosia nanyangense TaxID=1228055 RepID=A0A933L6M1_9HYPH|nr:sugar ABC transporter ATP-binding protein [Devosia nanyangense]
MSAGQDSVGTAGDHVAGKVSPEATDAAISVVNIKKYFGPTRALDGCSFSARLGEIHAIVGGNGCGKSTLAKVLSGVLPVDSGQVSVLGRMATTPHEAREIGLATVFQEVMVADEASIVDNLYMGADHLFSKALSAPAKVRAAETLMHDLTGEEVDVEELVGTLPLGMKQWITIGRALLTEPRILILDESSAALDLDSTERLFAKMRQLRDQGAAVLIVTHRIAELIRISDRATVLRDGRDVGVLERQDITEKNLLSLMTGHAPEAKARGEDGVTALANPVVMRAEELRIAPESAPISIDIHKGEILGVAGLDGQGQSEFVRILAGVQSAAEGHPLVRSGSTNFKPLRSLREAVEAGVYFVSGDRKKEGIFANLSIFENMLMPLYRIKKRGGHLGWIDWKALDGIFNWEAEKLMIRMGARTNKITSLSGGNQQKLLIGRAFAMNPDIMVLNDPARGIDVGAKTELYKHLKDFAAAGKSVVYMSSELEEFIGFASRVIVFRNGSIFDAFDASELNPARILEAMFGQTSGQGAAKLTGRRAAEPASAVERSAASPALEADWQAKAIENPLWAPRPPLESPFRSRPAVAARRAPEAPFVPSIKIVEFDAKDNADRDPYRPDSARRGR